MEGAIGGAIERAIPLHSDVPVPTDCQADTDNLPLLRRDSLPCDHNSASVASYPAHHSVLP
jgi:hypothetical protein